MKDQEGEHQAGRGFAGLSSLVSVVDVAERSGPNEVPASEAGPDAHVEQKDDEVAGRARGAAGADGPGATDTSRSQSVPAVGSPSGAGSGWGWFGAAAVLFIFLLAVADQTTPPAKPSRTSAPTAAPKPQSSPPVPTAQQPAITFSRPPVGQNSVLGVAQIRWCLREQIHIDTIRPLATTRYQVERFNEVVGDYNARCGSYRYRPGDMNRARSQVEAMHTEIVRRMELPWIGLEAGEARWSSRSEGVAASDSGTTAELVRNETVRAIQAGLLRLGYPSGPVDGLEGEQTLRAARAFARDHGLPPTSALDSEFLSLVEAAMLRAEAVSAEQASPQKPPTKPEFAARFTRGSPERDVLRTQGNPSRIDRYSSHETWWYGRSQVSIDPRSRRVLDWDNKGNLRVEMRPGRQVTSASAFTRGSHEDDVIRVQGTPSEIDRYSSHEAWWYGRSQVSIDPRSRRVLDWDNKGNLRVEMRPGRQVTSASAFTRDSHEDDVIRVQGTPSEIDRYSSHEAWWYGRSQVSIDPRSRRVLDWDNKGNLRVEMRPGRQVTSAPSFTHGSHADDVLRLQGTPSDIDRYSTFETWWFGRSHVRIDPRSGRVVDWTNAGNLRVRM